MFNFENYSIAASLSGLAPFALYLVIAITMVKLFLVIYTRVTPHNEWELIKENNVAAAISLGGACIGFILPLVTAMNQSVNALDFAIWGVIALLIQIVLFYTVRIPFPKLICRIKDGEVAMGTIMAFFSVGAGMLNAAAMTY